MKPNECRTRENTTLPASEEAHFRENSRGKEGTEEGEALDLDFEESSNVRQN
jgi:hypothetical protein